MACGLDQWVRMFLPGELTARELIFKYLVGVSLDRGVAILRELVEQTNDLVGDPDQRRLERFDVQRSEECLRNSDEAPTRR